MRVILSRRANLDLLGHLDWLTQRSPAAARRTAGDIATALRLLTQFPHAGGASNMEEREWIIRSGRDGYIAVYRVEANRIVIGRLFHSKQDRTGG
ncbi:MAG: type II toxin-antitoxin system RelE/ParE family toxin [Brevundimonas sp.]|uniref:type II toxin-antitoxin system RelE/ParE family toxin n=1 Tax=Brevundimonas sp. TaxID=1871086 RepID=UPI00273590C6|nr:type II toxin-antitoxin system RelE/ParE family toxin [Brevundimonas sp.]MDP3403852.1 type II toxin-antitoxin system RelE/ParE family toxin [Brevundimonas sp.]